jgi:hypothetical protein
LGLLLLLKKVSSLLLSFTSLCCFPFKCHLGFSFGEKPVPLHDIVLRHEPAAGALHEIPGRRTRLAPLLSGVGLSFPDFTLHLFSQPISLFPGLFGSSIFLLLVNAPY